MPKGNTNSKSKWHSIYCYQNIKKGHHRYGWCYVGRTHGKNKVRSHQSRGLLGEDLQTFPDNIISLVAWTGECTSEEINEKEKYYIKEYNSISPNGYNLNHGGQGPIEHTKEAIEKIRKATIEQWKDPKIKKKRKKMLKKAGNKPEEREKRRKRAIERWKDPKQREKLIKEMNRPEVKERRRKAAIEQWEDPEVREKTIKTLKIVMSKSEEREKRRKANQGKKPSKETKAKMCKSQQERRRREKEEKDSTCSAAGN